MLMLVMQVKVPEGEETMPHMQKRWMATPEIAPQVREGANSGDDTLAVEGGQQYNRRHRVRMKQAAVQQGWKGAAAQ
jgi:hypothetical protein